MPYKQILVNDKVHKKVKKIADMNYRGMGAQVEYWADGECPHPIEMREMLTVQIAIPDKAGNLGKAQSVRIFICRQCNRIVWNGVH